MSVSSIINKLTGKIYDELIPQGGGVALTKGQLISANNQNPPVEVAVPVGVNGTILMADSTQDDGLRWAVVPGAVALAQGQLLSADLAGDPTLVPAPILPAQANYVLSADGSAGALGTNLLWKPPTGAGGLIDANLPLIDTAGVGTNKISINFSANVGEIPYGNGTALTGALTNTPTALQFLGVVGGVPAWKDAGGSGTVSAIPPLYEQAGGQGDSQIYLNYSANIGEIPYGNGTAQTGAFTNVPVAGDILGMAGTPPVPTWINAPANVGTLVNRNNVDNVPLIIQPPISSNSTMIITADRTYQVFTPAQIYNDTGAGIVNVDATGGLTFLSYTPVADIVVSNIVVQIFIVANVFPVVPTNNYGEVSIYNGATLILQGDSDPFGAVCGNLIQFNIPAPTPTTLLQGTTYTFEFSITSQVSNTVEFVNTQVLGVAYQGNASITGIQYLAQPATFTLNPPNKFRITNSLTGFSSATCESFSSQSFVATGQQSGYQDWILVGGANGGITLVP